MLRETKKDMEKFGMYDSFVRHVHNENKTRNAGLNVDKETFIGFMHWLFDDGNVVFSERVAGKYFDEHYEYVDNDPDWLTHSNELLDSIK